MNCRMAVEYIRSTFFALAAAVLTPILTTGKTAMHTITVARGVQWVAIPEADLSMLLRLSRGQREAT